MMMQMIIRMIMMTPVAITSKITTTIPNITTRNKTKTINTNNNCKIRNTIEVKPH